jgi:hypothetical protein
MALQKGPMWKDTGCKMKCRGECTICPEGSDSLDRNSIGHKLVESVLKAGSS